MAQENLGHHWLTGQGESGLLIGESGPLERVSRESANSYGWIEGPNEACICTISAIALIFRILGIEMRSRFCAHVRCYVKRLLNG